MQARIVGSAGLIVKDMKRVAKIREQVAVSSANRATAKVRTEVVRDVAKTVGIPQKFLRGTAGKGGRVRQYKYKKITGRSRVWMGLQKVPLRKVFNGKKPGGGVAKFQRYVSGSLNGRSSSDAFSATMSTGVTGIFVRKAGAGRLPIQEVALDIKAVGNASVKRMGRVHGGPTFEKEHDRQLRRRLKRL